MSRLIRGQLYKAFVPPLVKEARRRPLPRFNHGGRSMCSGGAACWKGPSGAAAATHPPSGNTTLQRPFAKPATELDAERESAHRQITEIETKKHELFYLLADMDKRYPGRRYVKNNKELIHHLFRHVEPNPSDALWRHALGRERFNKCVIYGMPTLMATWMYLDWEGWRNTFAFLLGIGH